MSGLELGGLAGSLSAGALSDYLMRKNTGAKQKGNVGLRVQVCCCAQGYSPVCTSGDAATNSALEPAAVIHFYPRSWQASVQPWSTCKHSAYLLSPTPVNQAAEQIVQGLAIGSPSVNYCACSPQAPLCITRKPCRTDELRFRCSQVVIAYALATAAFLALFWACPNVAWMQWLVVAAVGFSLYGPQMLIGLAGAETVAPESVSACQGFLGWISYFGKHPVLHGGMHRHGLLMGLCSWPLALTVQIQMYQADCCSMPGSVTAGT